MQHNSRIWLDANASLRIGKIFETWGYPDPQLYIHDEGDWRAVGVEPLVVSEQIKLCFGDIQLIADLPSSSEIMISFEQEEGKAIILANDVPLFQFLLPHCQYEASQWDIFIRWVPSAFVSTKVVLLQLQEEDNDSQYNFMNVSSLILQQCDWLTTLQNFQNIGGLEEISIFNCASLKNIQHLSDASDLKLLELRWCGSIEFLPDFSRLLCLEQLRLQWCSKLQQIQTLSDHPRLRELHISACNSLGSLPDLSNCLKLHTLYFSWFRTTPYFPRFSNLPSLRVLNLQSCAGIEKLPDLSSLKSLYRLNISDCQDLKEIKGLSGLNNLRVFEANGCTQLASLSLNGLNGLSHLQLGRCVQLEEIHGLQDQVNLLSLHISGSSLVLLSGVSELRELQKLYLSDCRNLSNLSGLKNLKNLSSLQIFGCPSLIELDGVSHCTQLRELRLGGLRQVKSLPDLAPLSGLRDLTISWFQMLSALPSLDGLNDLRSLKLGGHDSLTHLDRLERFPRLSVLDLSRCASITKITGLEHLKKLSELDLHDCQSLKRISGLAGLGSLRTLNLHGCKSLSALSELPMLHHLQHLDLGKCRELRYIPSFGHLKNLRYLDLSNRLYPTVISEIHQNSKIEEVHLQNTSAIIGLNHLKSCNHLKDIHLLDPLEGADILINAVLNREDRFLINSNIDDWIVLLKKHKDQSSYLIKLISLLQLLPHSSDTILLWRELIRMARQLGPANNMPSPITTKAWKVLGEALCQLTPQMAHEPIHDLIFNLDPYYEAVVMLPSLLSIFPSADITIQAWLAELVAEQGESYPEEIRTELLPHIVQFFSVLGYPQTAERWIRYAENPHTSYWVKRCRTLMGANDSS